MTLLNLGFVQCTIVGTTATLSSAAQGYKTWIAAGATDGVVLTYCLQDIDPATNAVVNSEMGRGTWHTGNTFTLDTVLDSSNSDIHIAITKQAWIRITAAAEDILELGTGATNAAAGNHLHAGVYQPAGSYLTAESDPDHAAWLAALRDANTFPAGPATGVPAALAWRALVAADIPALNYEPTISILAASKGGTGVANGALATLTLPNFPITIAGGVTGGTYTLPATVGGDTIATLGAANVFTAAQKINVNSTTAMLVEQDGVKDNVFVVDTTNGYVGINGTPATAGLSLFGNTNSSLEINVPKIYVKNLNATGACYIELAAGNGAVRGWLFADNGTVSTGVDFRVVTNHPFNIWTNNIKRITVLGSGATGFGTTAPDRTVEINTGAATGGMRLTYNDSNGSATTYVDLLVDSGGDLTLTPTGGNVIISAGSVLNVGSNQVVGARVVDARIDDAINTGDATTDGVIDAIRDILIAHGLAAAAA